MLVIGAKGTAKDILAIQTFNKGLKDLCFYDDVNADALDKLYNIYPILKSPNEAKKYFTEIDQRFAIGVGDPISRYKIANKFEQLGGKLVEVICNKADVCWHDITIEKGAVISFGCAISNSVTIKKGAFINAKSIIGHDSEVGEFTEVCPSVSVLGHCKIGKFSFIGTGSIIYPNVTIGNNVMISAGSIVKRDIPDNALVNGNPAKVLRIKSPLKLD